MKKCSKCGEQFPATAEYFYRHTGCKDGLRSYCKKCQAQEDKKYRKANREHLRKVRKRYRKENKEQTRKYQKRYRKENKEQMRKYQKRYRKENKEYTRKLQKRWYKANKEHLRKYQKKRRKENKEYIRKYQKRYQKANKEYICKLQKRWREANKDHVRKHHRRYQKKRLNESPAYRLNDNISRGIYGALRGSKNGRHWETLVGYTLGDLVKHLEALFETGMTWENYGEWHIDHIIPVSAFNFTESKHADFKRCWALENLQPMWASENISKGNKIDSELQPSLTM